MDGRIAAFQGGLVLGYFLRVWENVTAYERILDEEAAQEAEAAVADEIEDQIPAEVEEQLADDAETELLDRFGEIDEELADELREKLEEQTRS